MFKIRVIPKEDFDEIVPFIQTLNENMDKNILAGRIESIKEYNYTCIGIFDKDKLIGISGIWILYKFYVGKHIEPDNVIIIPDYRGRGVGKQLMEWIHAYAKEQNCNTAELNCLIKNSQAHKFYINLGYEIIGFHFIKKL